MIKTNQLTEPEETSGEQNGADLAAVDVDADADVGVGDEEDGVVREACDGVVAVGEEEASSPFLDVFEKAGAVDAEAAVNY